MAGSISNKRWLVGGLIGAAIVVGAAGGLLYAMGAAPFKAPDGASGSAATKGAQNELSRFATGAMAALDAPAELKPAPDYEFHDRNGNAARFADFRGRVAVVNLWAMWCAPCRTEMPTLAALQAAYPVDRLAVVTVNVDDRDDAIIEARSFLDVHEPLVFYNDRRFQLPFEFPGKGKMPQTIILDRQGRVRAWLAGEADWSSAEARALMDALLAEPQAGATT